MVFSSNRPTDECLILQCDSKSLDGGIITRACSLKFYFFYGHFTFLTCSDKFFFINSNAIPSWAFRSKRLKVTLWQEITLEGLFNGDVLRLGWYLTREFSKENSGLHQWPVPAVPKSTAPFPSSSYWILKINFWKWLFDDRFFKVKNILNSSFSFMMTSHYYTCVPKKTGTRKGTHLNYRNLGLFVARLDGHFFLAPPTPHHCVCIVRVIF